MMSDLLIPDDVVEISSEMLLKFLRLARGINGSGFIKYSSANKNDVTIRYYCSFSEYKQDNPDSTIRREAFDYYFAERQDAEMLIMREPMKIMTALSMVRSVSLLAPVDSICKKVSIDRKTAEKYFKIDFREMSLNDNKWRKFVDKCIIDNTKRKAFLKKFVVESEEER